MVFWCGGESSHSTHTIAHSQAERVVCVCDVSATGDYCSWANLPNLSLHICLPHTRVQQFCLKHLGGHVESGFCTTLSNISRLKTGRVFVSVFLRVHLNCDELAKCTYVWVFHLPASFKAEMCHFLLLDTLFFSRLMCRICH